MGRSREKVGRRRSPGVSLAAHPERSGGVGDKQAVAGEAGEGGAGFQEGSCRLLSLFEGV